MDNQGNITDYEKETMRAASEIAKGIISNPNVQISIQDDRLVFSFGGQGGRNIAFIFLKALEGVKQGLAEKNKRKEECNL